MDISDSDEEDEQITHVDESEPNLDLPSTSSTQPNTALPTDHEPHTINVSPLLPFY